MQVVNFWTHLPYLRITEETYPFGPGLLWRLPFEIWSYLTGGAYDEEQSSYEATTPVFFYLEAEVDWPFIVPGQLEKWQAVEIKKPTHGGDEVFREAGFAFLTEFLRTYAWSAQAALSLAVPAAGVGSPRHSLTFCAPDDAYFRLPTQEATIARIQGDADHELLLLAESTSDPIDGAQARLASDLWPVVRACRDDGQLGPALTALMSCAEPGLTDIDQMVLGTVAIEALLLPEIRSGLQQTFIKRVTELMSNYDAAGVEWAARNLYDARSAALHGETTQDQDDASRLERSGAAQQILAASILALVEDRPGGDHAPGPVTATTPALDLERPPGARSPYRLGHTGPTSAPFVASFDANMAAEEGEVLSWSPLLGLGCSDPMAMAAGRFVVMPLDAVELVAMEERDIARDFVNQVRTQHALETLASHSAIALHESGEPSFPELVRRRELAVAVLRLAGFADFIDPTLLGWFIYQGSMRIRIPTVFRQTIVRTMVDAPGQMLTQADEARMGDITALISTYDSKRRDPEVDRLLGQFLRGHGSQFLPRQASAGLMFGVLEGILGRFRPKKERIQLEDLVAVAAVASETVEWFMTMGRDFRNAVAHGRWDPGTHELQLETLTSVCAMVFSSLLEFCVASGDDQRPPVEGFMVAMEARVVGS